MPELRGGAHREHLSQAARQTLDPLGEKRFCKADCGPLHSLSADSDQGAPGAPENSHRGGCSDLPGHRRAQRGPWC
ncbi:hypothetical protein E2320_014240 [Naja naja]|nr:hypothetical protein E2320_014240 [Naja naja]